MKSMHTPTPDVSSPEQQVGDKPTREPSLVIIRHHKQKRDHSMMNIMDTTTTHPQHMDDHLEPRQPAQLPVRISKDSPTDGELIGIPPKTFDGDRSKTDTFITQFYPFRIINEGNTVMTNPKRRVALALSYIRGPKVDAWVTQQCDALSIKNNDAWMRANMDEALWEDFIAEFKRAFAEPKWKVIDKLEHLQMAGDEVEMYIAKFENLVHQQDDMHLDE